MEVKTDDRSVLRRLMDARAEFPPIVPSGVNKAFKDASDPSTAAGSPYAKLGELFRAVNPVLSKHGLLLEQKQDVNHEKRSVTLETKIVSDCGEIDFGTITFLVPSNGKQTDFQAFGTAVTYARRYGLVNACGLSADGDSDGNIEEDNKFLPSEAPRQNPRRSHRQTQTQGPKAVNSPSQLNNGVKQSPSSDEWKRHKDGKTLYLQAGNFTAMVSPAPTTGNPNGVLLRIYAQSDGKFVEIDSEQVEMETLDEAQSHGKALLTHYVEEGWNDEEYGID